MDRILIGIRRSLVVPESSHDSMCMMSLLQVHDIMTTWQLRGHFLDLDLACWQSAPCSISRIFPHVYAAIQSRVSVGNIYNLLRVARSQSAGSCIHSITDNTHYTCTQLRPNYPFWPELIVILPWEAHASKWITDTLLRTDIGAAWAGKEELSKCRYKAGDGC